MSLWRAYLSSFGLGCARQAPAVAQRRIHLMCDAYALDDGFDAIGVIAGSKQATLEAWLEAHWDELEAAMGQVGSGGIGRG